MSQKISIADALDAIERNLKVFLKAAGFKVGRVAAMVDGQSGTASIKHTLIGVVGDMAINVDVYLPAMPAQAVLSTPELDRWVGYFVHELCHAFYTDETAWRDAVREGIHAMVNALEDVRIEAKLNRDGIIGNSRAVLNSLLAFVVDQLPANYNPNDLRNLPWLFAMTGRLIVCGYEIPQVHAHMAAMKPAIARLVDDVMAKVAKANDTNDILAIARDLVAAFKQAKGNQSTQPTQPTQPGKGEPGKGEPGEGSQPGQSEPETGKGEPGEPEGQSEGEGSQQAPQGGKAGDGQGAPGNGEGELEVPAGFDAADMREVDLKPETAASRTKSRQLARDTGYADSDFIESVRRAQKIAGKPLPEGKPMHTGAAETVTRLTQQAMACGTLRQHVARVLRAEETETWQRGRASGRLDRFALGRLSMGAVDNVYCKRTISGGYETEISVLVDGSASMGGTPAWASAVLAYVITQAAAQVGVKSEVSQFRSGSSTAIAIKHPNGSPMDRTVQRTFAKMGLDTGGSTPLSKNITIAAARLAYRAPTKRKLLFVISDGMCDSGPQGVKMACDYAERLGVETVALCIGVPVHVGFKHGVTCDVSNIAAAGLGKLVQVLARD